MSDRVVVVFRKWRDRTGDVIALFPKLPSDIHGRYCDSYEHTGQHGGADYYGVIQSTTPAPPLEAARLKRELEMIGYRLRPLRRASYVHHERRRQEAQRFRQDT